MAGANARDDANWQTTMAWLNPAHENAKSIATNASKFASQTNSVAKQARKDLFELPPCDDTTVKSKINQFLDSMDEAKSSGEGVKRQCTELSSEWNEFHEHMTREGRREEDVSSQGFEVILAKLDKLKVLCSKCNEEYSIAREKMSEAIDNCSRLENALAIKVKELMDAESSRKIKGYVATGFLVAGAVATGGASVVLATGAKAAAYTAGGLTVASIGAGLFTWNSSKSIRKLADDMDSTRGSMNTHLRELNVLSDLISTLEKQTQDLAKNMETGRGLQNRLKRTMDKKDRELEKLKKLLEEQGISYSD